MLATQEPVASTVVDSDTKVCRSPAAQSSVVVPVPVILSALSLMISAWVVVVILSRTPLGEGLDAYDLSTAEAAMLSMNEMISKRDLLAMYQYGILTDEPKVDQKLATFTVHQTSEWQQRRVLFVSYELDGMTRYDTPAFAKDAATGLWIESYNPGRNVFSGVAASGGAWRGDGDGIVEKARMWCDTGKLH